MLEDDDDTTEPTDDMKLQLFKLCIFIVCAISSFWEPLGGTKEGTRQGLRTAVHVTTAVLIP